MAGNLGDIAGTVSLNIDPFQQSTRVLEAQTKNISRALRAQEMSAKNSGKSLNGLKAMYNTTGNAVSSYTKLLDGQKKSYDDYKASIGDVTKASDEEIKKLMSKESAYLTTAAKLEQMTGKYNSLGKQIAIQESGFTKMGDKLTSMGDKATKAGDGMMSFGKKMSVGLTAPIVAGAGIAIKAASDYESAFAGVKKTVDGTPEQFEALSNGIRKMATELPASAVEIANVAEAAGQLGIQTPNILSFSETMIKMGVATNMTAEDAATSMARFANVMGMSQTDFDRFGSSVVQLGNNFATTESEILQMSLRLSGIGKQTGMTEAAVVGISAAMSTMGIEAEAGGTAMTQGMKKMQNAVMGGTKELDSFAKTAGMTSEQFSTLFKEDASQALLAYVEGLEKASKGGKNLNDVLDEVGIKGIRESDTFLRLAGDSSKLKDALQQSGTAWKENTALTNEAAVRFETLESKMKILKGQVNDVAIEFGGPLVDALSDGIEAAKPLLNVVGDLAKKFSEASPETQQMVIKTLAFGAAIGPVTGTVGKFTSLIGGGLSTVGEFSKFLGTLGKDSATVKSGMDVATEGTKLFSKGAEGANKSVGLFGKSVLGLNPWVAGIGLTLGAGVVAWELWGKGAVDSAKRTAKWGSDVGSEADKTLTKFQSLSNDGAKAIEDLSNGVEGSAERIGKAFQNMAEEMHKSVDTSYKKNLELIKKMPQELQASMMKDLENKKKIDEQTIAAAEDVNNKVMQIISSKNAKEGKLSSDQKALLLEHQRTLNAKEVELMDVGANEKKEILSALNGDIQDMNEKQLSHASQTVADSLTKQKEAHRQQSEDLKEIYKDDVETYTKKAAELKTVQDAETENMVNNYIKIMEEQGKSDDFIKSSLQSKGFSYDEAAKFVENYSDRVVSANSIVAQSNGEVSESTQKANDSWNTLIFDPKTGEIKTNLPEFLNETAQSDEGWNQLAFIAKEANLTSDAKEKVFEAMSSAGEWNQLGIPDKMLNADNLQLILGLSESKESLNEFNSISPELKKLLVDGSDKMKIDESRTALDQYNALSPQLKNLLTNNADTMSKVNSAKTNLSTYDAMKPGAKILTANNSNAVSNTNTAKATLENFNGLNIPTKHIKTSADTSGATQAKAAIDSVPASKTSTITTWFKSIYQKITKHKTGTNNHPGGDAILGDGGKNEPYLTPQGHFGISPNKDTLFPNLPKGTKVWSSIDKFKKDVPVFDDYSNTKAVNLMSKKALAAPDNSKGQTIMTHNYEGLMKGATFEIKDKYDIDKLMIDIESAIRREGFKLE